MRQNLSSTSTKPAKAESRRSNAIGAQHKNGLECHPLWILEPRLFEAVLQVVSRHDLESIATGANPRGWIEYATEVEDLLPLLKHATSVADVERVIRQVFRQYFGSATPPSAAMAGELWKCLRRPKHWRALARVVDLESPIKKVVKKMRQTHTRNDRQMHLALAAALEREASRIKTEKDLRRIFGEAANH